MVDVTKDLFRSEGVPSHVTHAGFVPSITHSEGVVGFVSQLEVRTENHWELSQSPDVKVFFFFCTRPR